MKPSDFENFIFDLDGTLFTLPVDWTAVRDEFASLAGEQIGNRPLFQEVQRVTAARPAIKQSVLDAIEVHEMRVLDSVKPLPGAVELVYSLFEVSKLGLVTLQGRRVCDEILKKHKLSDLFETVVTREDSLDRAAQLEAALNRLEVRPKDALFVGDRMNDVTCAKKVGIAVALVTKVNYDEPKPDFRFGELAELRVFFP